MNTGAKEQGEGDSTTNLGKITDKAGATAKGAITAGEKAKASGLSSTAIGFNALATGVNSVAVGSNTKALGDQTVAIGYNTGDKATVAHRSTFIGADAGQNSNGTPQATGLQEGYNVYIGDGAGKAAVGTHNTAVGSASTGAGVIGDINVAFGHAALYNTKGNENAGFGAYAGQNSSGINNTAIGAHAGRRVTGDNNTALGNNAGTGVTANQTVSLGAAAKATHDKAVALGAGSTTSAAVGTTEATVNGITYSTFYGTNPVATVSVGSNTEKRTITNVAAGRINARSTDAINGSQLYLTQDRLGNVANAVVNNFGGNATLNPNKQGDITFTNIGDTGKDNIHDAIKAATTKVKGDKGVTVTSEVSATDGSTTYTVSATTGNITTDDKGNATTDMPNALTTVQNVVDAINASGFTLTAQGGNGSLVKPGSTVDMKNTDGNIVISKSADNNDVVYNLAKDITVDSVKAGDTTINNDGLIITGGPSVTKIGIDAASNKITNVAAGEADTDAVNVSQLKDAQQVNQAATTWKVNTEASSEAKSVSNQTVTVNHGINTKVSEVKQDADGNYSYEIDVTGLPMEYVDAKGNTLVNVGGKFYSQKEGNNGELVLTPSTPAKVRISSDKPMQLTNVDKGEISATSTDAVNGSQLHETNQDVANNTANIAKNKAEIDKGLDFAGDKGEFNRKLGQKTTVKGGITDESKLSNNNIGVIAKDGTLEVKLAKDIKVDSVETGNTVINNDGITIAAPTKDNPKNTVSLSSSGLNNGGNRITNVAPGVDGTDAVNVNQLKGVANNLNNRMHKVDKNLRAGIAGALASGDLPQPYLPGKSMIALGGGSYRGESAIAIGASRNSDNGKWIIKGSANTDSRGHVGVSGSVGYQF